MWEPPVSRGFNLFLDGDDPLAQRAPSRSVPRGLDMGGPVEVIRINSQTSLDGILEDQIGAGIAGPGLGQALA